MRRVRGAVDPIDAHVGGRLRQARREANVSQTAVGKALGITFQQVQKYEKGTNRIAMSRIAQISRMLNKPVNWFFDGVPTSKNEIATYDLMKEFTSRKHGLRLAEAFVRINNPRQQVLVTQLAESFAGDRRKR